MPYCVLADITNRISEETVIQLSDDGNLGVVDQAVVDGAIADAGELIDGYLRGRYILPLDPVPGLVRALSLDLAVYGLYSRRASFEVPEPVTDRYKNAVKLLSEIQKGNVTLGSAGVETPVATGGAASVSGPERIFSRDSLKGY